MPRLFTIQDGRSIPLRQLRFLDEAALEALLEGSPELLSMDELDPSAAAPMIPIGRQIGLGGQALDLLFLDMQGTLVGVETKLRKNPEIRRQVVGQVLEYGAHLSEWTVEDVERQASTYLAKLTTPARFRGRSMVQLMAEVAGDGMEPLSDEELRERIVSKLSRGDLRLVIAVDRVVDSLRKIVTFANAKGGLSLVLLEVQETELPDSQKVLPMEMCGASGAISRLETRSAWDDERFVDALREQTTDSRATVARRLLSFAQQHADSIVWGVGTSEGTAGFGLRVAGKRLTIFTLVTSGKITISSSILGEAVKLDTRTWLLEKLRELGVDAPHSKLEKPGAWITFDANLLSAPANTAAFETLMIELCAKLRE